MQDKAIARYLVKNIVEAAAVRDLTEASAYSGMREPRIARAIVVANLP